MDSLVQAVLVGGDADATQVWFVGETPTLRRKDGVLPSFSVFSPAVEEG
ncbi:MAG: hypothetical protein ACK4P5_04755 [Fimbriimonadales bacterium]